MFGCVVSQKQVNNKENIFFINNNSSESLIFNNFYFLFFFVGSTWLHELLWLVANDFNFDGAKEYHEIRTPFLE